MTDVVRFGVMNLDTGKCVANESGLEAYITKWSGKKRFKLNIVAVPKDYINYENQRVSFKRVFSVQTQKTC